MKTKASADAVTGAREAQALCEVIDWLRQRLESRIPETADTQPSAGGKGRAAGNAGTAQTTPEHAPADPGSPLAALRERLGLSAFEADTLALCAAMEFDSRIAALCSQLQGHEARGHPSFALAFAVFDEASWDALSPDRPLRHWRLIEIAPDRHGSLSASALRADERIVNFLKGLDHLDERLSSLLAPMPANTADAQLPPSQQDAADTIRRWWKRHDFRAVQLLGPDAASKQLVAAGAARTCGLQLYGMAIDLLPTAASEVEPLARLMQREALLSPIALYLDAQDLDAAEQTGLAALRRLVAHLHMPLFIAVPERLARFDRDSLAIDIGKPTTSEQCQAWRAMLGDGAAALADRLCGQFDLNLVEIHWIGTDTQDGPAKTRDDRIWNACRATLRPRLLSLAQMVVPRVGWHDIVLPDEPRELLRQIASQVAHRSLVHDAWGFSARTARGLGITALFAGESGTGKSMAAEIIAAECRLDLYRIDLSTVVSKYIGDTERNLRRMFDAAEQGGAILLFDEADALFGKRSEVKDSHDRYANIEVNYLLQRMEAYRGVAILATNARSALDHAFMRRLRFVVNFPYPGRIERALIWRKAFPPVVQLAALDYERLARLNLTGGNIQTTALNAAFLAAADCTAVTMRHVLTAARHELVKLNRPIDETELALPPAEVAA